VARPRSFGQHSGSKLKHNAGGLAQLGERRPCKAEVIGSNPIFSTILDHKRTIEV
jgi:hypothetical protein